MPACPPMRAVLSNEDFELIRALLNRHAGLWFASEMRSVIERRLRDRLALLNIDTFGEYMRRLSDGDTLELGEAVEICTVNETYAFRGARQLRTLRDVILPRVAQGRSLLGEPSASSPRAASLAVWSAGCSTGEEVYTVAAIALASGLFDPTRVRIFGTDISRRCVAAARKGVYSTSSFREDDVGMPYQHYFVKQLDGTRVVNDALRSVCHFRHANLLEESSPGFLDVVFCRNVLIHMDEVSRRKIVESFYKRLSPGGFLILGHSESLLKEQTEFVVEELPDDIIYRKPNVGEEPGTRSSYRSSTSRASRP